MAVMARRPGARVEVVSGVVLAAQRFPGASGRWFRRFGGRRFSEDLQGGFGHEREVLSGACWFRFLQLHESWSLECSDEWCIFIFIIYIYLCIVTVVCLSPAFKFTLSKHRCLTGMGMRSGVGDFPLVSQKHRGSSHVQTRPLAPLALLIDMSGSDNGRRCAHEAWR